MYRWVLCSSKFLFYVLIGVAGAWRSIRLYRTLRKKVCKNSANCDIIKIPLFVPAFHGVWIISLPLFRYTFKLFKSGVLRRSVINGFQVICKLFLILIAHIFQCVSYLMDDAALQFCLRKCRIYGFFYTRKSVCTDNKNVLYAPVFQLIQHSKPILCTFIFSNMYGQNFLVAC